MGKTVEAYRTAIEIYEIPTWKPYRNSLNEEGKEAFDALMDACRVLASEASCACNPILFQPMTMSMLLTQQKQIMKLEKEVKRLTDKTT